jgi:hypothetical protein
LRRQVAIDFSKIPRDLQGKLTLDTPGYDPLHAAYIAAQNFTGFFMEEVTKFPEFDSYWKIYGPTQKEYMPSGPPISPLTKSFFTTWAFFDLRSGPDGETIGTCLLDVAELLEMDPFMVETIRQFQDSRMGIYEHCGVADGRWRLRELVTVLGTLSIDASQAILAGFYECQNRQAVPPWPPPRKVTTVKYVICSIRVAKSMQHLTLDAAVWRPSAR